MTSNILCLFVAICTCGLVVEAPRPPDTPVKASVLPFHTDCEEDCSSAKKAYYCGDNGRTYDSHCRVLQAKCSDPYLNVTAGKCKSSAVCRKERAYFLRVHNLPNSTESANIPSCNRDGTFGPTQCSVKFGYCWCVTRIGIHIKNSTFKIGTNGSCDSRSKARSRKKRCDSEADKTEFAIKVRELITATRRRSRPMSPEKERDTLNGKYQAMDKNGDGSLSKKEMRKLLKTFRRKFSRDLRPCMRIFAKHCDFYEDGGVSEIEWGLCLGFKQVREQPPIQLQSRNSSVTKRDANQTTRGIKLSNNTFDPDQAQSTSPSSSVITCREKRNEVRKLGQKHVGIPACEGANDEFYKRVQCHSLFCYCVRRDTGVPLPSTPVTRYNGTPDCDRAERETPHPIPNCPKGHTETFLRKVRNLLVEEMPDSNVNGDGGDVTQSVEEKAAKWYFRRADKNRDDALDRRENNAFKKLLRKIKVSKKCLKSFTQHCDRNSDRRTSLPEFIACLAVRRQVEPIRPGILPGLIESINQLQTTEDP